MIVMCIMNRLLVENYPQRCIRLACMTCIIERRQTLNSGPQISLDHAVGLCREPTGKRKAVSSEYSISAVTVLSSTLDAKGG